MFAKPILRSSSTTMSPVNSARSARSALAFSIAAAMSFRDRRGNVRFCKVRHYNQGTETPRRTTVLASSLRSRLASEAACNMWRTVNRGFDWVARLAAATVPASWPRTWGKCGRNTSWNFHVFFPEETKQ